MPAVRNILQLVQFAAPGLWSAIQTHTCLHHSALVSVHMDRPSMATPGRHSTCCCSRWLCCAGDGIEEDEAAAALGWPYVRVLLAPAERYPAERVLSWRPDAATGGPGLPFVGITVHHIHRAAELAEPASRAAAAEDGGS